MPEKTIVAWVCAGVIMVALPPAVGGQTLTGTERRVTTAAADQFDPAIDGSLVVYTDFSGIDADVWYTDLATGLAYPVTTASGDQQLTGVSGHRIVYTDWNTLDVLVYDVATGTTENLTNPANSNSVDPAIDGDLVAWTDDRDGNAEIYARDLSTGEERRITTDPLSDQIASVRDGVIVWERCDGYACDVFAYDWAAKRTTRLTDTPWASERFPDVAGHVVVFQREQGTPIDKDIVAYDLLTGTERVLARPGDQENAHISGDFVSFNDSSSGIPHIGLWQLSTGATFEVPAGGGGQYLNDIDGRRIVYSDNRNETLDIYLYEFDIVPAGDTEPPAIHGAADLAVDATSPQGAIVAYEVSATDDTDPSPVLVCTPPSGETFPIATTIVSCTAIDASGNAAHAAFAVTVRGAVAQIDSLGALVASLKLRRGIDNSLDAKLKAARAAIAGAHGGAVPAACGPLGAFVNEVTAQAGKAIATADAAALVAAAARIRSALGCG